MTWPIKKLREWFEHLAPGTTARRNHDECTSGRDLRRRLYVTKSDDNSSLKCYCHNCGKGTVINLDAPRIRPVLKPSKYEPVKLPPPWRSAGSTPLTHPLHKLWLKSYGITEGAARERNIYSADDKTLIFPVLGGYQARYFDRKPKWKIHGHLEPFQRGEGAILIAEDFISALKWRSLGTRFGYMPLLGHRETLTSGQLGVLSTTHVVIVWLDNDKESVIEAAESIARQAAAHGLNVVLIRGGTDPKRYPKVELQKVNDVCIELAKSAPPDGGPYHVLEIQPPGKGVCA